MLYSFEMWDGDNWNSYDDNSVSMDLHALQSKAAKVRSNKLWESNNFRIIALIEEW